MSTPPVPPGAPKKRGCLFYGCISLALAFVLVMVLGYFGVQYARKSFKNLVENYTDAQPVAVDVVELPKEEAAELQKRVTTFQQALEQQDRQEELVLSDHEINALISKDPNLKGKVQVKIEGDRVRGRISWPLEDIGPIRLNGRYLNGLATFGVGLANGQLSITADDVEVNGKPLPPTLMTELKKKNLAQDIKDPKAAENISKFSSIEVRDGRIILKNKVK